jgi:hypothetical protein
MSPARVLRSAIALKPATLLHFHTNKTKYRLLFSAERIRRPGPKGPTKELIHAVVEMKRRNRSWGCKRVAQQMGLAFGLDNRQRRGPLDPRNPFPAESEFRRSVMVFLYWSFKDSLWSE